MGRIGGGELLIILVIALLIFGPGKLAEMGKGLGEGLKNFKKGIAHGDGAIDDDPPAPKPTTETTVTLESPKALPSGAAPAATVATSSEPASSDRAETAAPPRT